MRNVSILLALVLVACSGGSAPAPTSAPPTTVAAPARTETIASEQPFGCTLTPIVDGHVTWTQEHGPIADFAAAHEDGDGWLALPAEVASSAPNASRVIVITTDAVCTATLGEPQLDVEPVENQMPMVGRAIGGCGDAYAPFALLCPDDARVPDDLRWSPLTWGEITVVDDTTTDPMLLSGYRTRDFYGQQIPETDRAGDTEVVRGRSAQLRIGSEELGAAELSRAWFAAGTDVATGCPDEETTHAGIWRRVDGDWERVAEGDRFAGFVHGGDVVALVERGGASEDACEGANVCAVVALYTPGSYGAHPFLPRGRALAAFGFGELESTSEVRLMDTRAPCNEDDE